jgi:ketosteroid isomerase-like protein
MPSDSEIEQLERQFWQTMVDKDPDAAMRLIAEECLIAGPMGSMQIHPAKYAEMTKAGQWRLDSFDFSDVSVIFPNPDTGIIAYKVRQRGEMKGAPMDMECSDASTWVRDGEAWKCALHTETILKQA